MKALLYIRVSTKEQVVEGNSLSTQDSACRRYAENKKIEIIEVFREAGESAKTINRTQLQKMMEYCTTNKKYVDAILIHKIDRLSRETSDYLQLKSFFNALGIQVISASENIENSPIGRFIENVLAGSAQFDNEVRAERSKNGMVDAVKEGRWVWKAPLGYINTKVEGKNNIAPIGDSLTLDLLNEIWSLVDSGYSETESLKIVTTKGLLNTNGKPLTTQHISRMLRNRLYMGVIEAFGLTIRSRAIKPIIDELLWLRVNERILGKYKTPAKYKVLNPEFPLRGLLLCKAGHRMTGSAPRGNGGRYPKYHCPICRGTGNSFSASEINLKFVSFANNYSFRDDFAVALKEAVTLNLEEQNLSARKQLVKLNRRLLELDTYDKEITKKNIQKVYSDQHTMSMLDDNLRKKTEIKLEINQLSNSVDDAEEVVEFGTKMLSEIGNAWHQIDNIHIKSRFQKWLFPAGLSFDGERFGTSEIPLCISMNSDLAQQSSLLVGPAGLEPATRGL